MKLYHGTSVTFLAQTQRHGIRPRKDRASNWQENPSHPEMVYLTTAYPFYFATMSREEKVGVVFEIDAKQLDQKRLHPDEDFLNQLLFQRDRKVPTKAQHESLRADLDMFQHMWMKSLAKLGNCAYRGTVPRRAITRYCLFNSALRPDLAFHCMDASISFMNYEWQGEGFQKVVEWFFGDRKLLPMVDESETPEERKLWVAQSKDRTGIEVVDMKLFHARGKS